MLCGERKILAYGRGDVWLIQYADGRRRRCAVRRSFSPVAQWAIERMTELLLPRLDEEKKASAMGCEVVGKAK